MLHFFEGLLLFLDRFFFRIFFFEMTAFGIIDNFQWNQPSLTENGGSIWMVNVTALNLLPNIIGNMRPESAILSSN